MSVIVFCFGVIIWINEDFGKQVSEGELLVCLADLQCYCIEVICFDCYVVQVKIGLLVWVCINQMDLNGCIFIILLVVENNIVAFIVELDEFDYFKLCFNCCVEVFLIVNVCE